MSTPTSSDLRPSSLQENNQTPSPATAPVGDTHTAGRPNDDDSDSSELEEGEIVEEDLPRIPATAKPIPLHTGSARRFRRESPLHPFPHPPNRDSVEPNFEQSQRHYKYTPTPQYHNTPPR